MANIEKRLNADGSYSYRVSIRKKGIDIYRTFHTEEDAKLFEFYKERLITNMNNFDIPLRQRVTIGQLFELKENSMAEGRSKYDIGLCKQRCVSHFQERFVVDISLDDWRNFCKNLLNTDVFRGGKTERGKRKMSFGTVRKIFANISSCISYARNLGIEVENHPLTIINTFINPSKNQHV